MLAMGIPEVLQNVQPGGSKICGRRPECLSMFEVEETIYGDLCSHCAALYAPIHVELEDGGRHAFVDDGQGRSLPAEGVEDDYLPTCSSWFNPRV